MQYENAVSFSPHSLCLSYTGVSLSSEGKTKNKKKRNGKTGLDIGNSS